MKLVAFFFVNKYVLVLSFILVSCFFLRLNRLDFQSLWLDELHTAATCAPNVSWNRFWFIYTHDNHPPLFYFIEWIWLNSVGLGDKVVRFPALLFGVWGVYAVYVFGKKFSNKELGLILASLLCVNVYHIEYSQEARQYTLFFALVTFSFAYLYDILINKNVSKSSAIFYVLSTTGFLYTHYFGVYILASQAAMVTLFWANSGADFKAFWRKTEFRAILIYASLAVVLFSPMLPVLLKLSALQEGRDKPSQFVILEYILDFYGKQPVLIFLLGFFTVSVLVNKLSNTSKLFFIFSWLLLSLYIPYIKSMVSAPTMHIRYLTGSYPVLIIIVGYGIYKIQNKIYGYSILALFVMLSVINVFHEKRLYFTNTKCDWRSMGKYMAENNPNNYPLRDITPDLNPIEMDYRGVYGYYPNYYGNKTIMIKDELFLSSNNMGIWIFESWWMPDHKDFVKKLEEKNFKLTREQWYFGSHVMCYER